MDIVNGNGRGAEKFEWDSWVCAYAAFNGAMLQGYCGRVIHRHISAPIVKLVDAFEFVSIQQPQNGRTVRLTVGSPIEFTPIDEVTVTFLAMIELSGLSEEKLRPFHAARLNAKLSLKNMTSGRPVIHVP